MIVHVLQLSLPSIRSTAVGTRTRGLGTGMQVLSVSASPAYLVTVTAYTCISQGASSKGRACSEGRALGEGCCRERGAAGLHGFPACHAAGNYYKARAATQTTQTPRSDPGSAAQVLPPCHPAGLAPQMLPLPMLCIQYPLAHSVPCTTLQRPRSHGADAPHAPPLEVVSPTSREICQGQRSGCGSG